MRTPVTIDLLFWLIGMQLLEKQVYHYQESTNKFKDWYSSFAQIHVTMIKYSKQRYDD